MLIPSILSYFSLLATFCSVGLLLTYIFFSHDVDGGRAQSVFFKRSVMCSLVCGRQRLFTRLEILCASLGRLHPVTTVPLLPQQQFLFT